MTITNKSKKNMILTRATGVALSALMVVSVSAAMLTNSNVSAMPTDAVTGNKPVEKMSVLDINSGKDAKAGTHNMVAIKNTMDSEATTVAVKDASGQARIQLFDGNMNPIDYTTKRLSKDGKIQITIPMNPEDPYWYFVDVYQVPSPTATDFGFANLDEQGLRAFYAQNLKTGKPLTLESVGSYLEDADGTQTEILKAEGTVAFTPDETNCYDFKLFATGNAFFSLKMYDENGNFCGEMHSNIDADSHFYNNFYFEEGHTYYFEYMLYLEPGAVAETVVMIPGGVG